MDKTLNRPGTGILKSVIMCTLAYIIAAGAALGVGYGLSSRHLKQAVKSFRFCQEILLNSFTG